MSISLCLASPICSSALGPYCGIINGKQSPSYVLPRQDKTPTTEPRLDQLLGSLMEAFNEETSKNSKEPLVQGSYEVSGTLDAELKLTLQAGKWIVHPKDYMQLNLVGQVSKDSLSLDLNLVNSEFEKTLCSNLVAKFIPDSNEAWQPGDNVFLSGTWQGDYECNEIKSSATLNLNTIGINKDGSNKIKGILSFQTQGRIKSMSLEELEETVKRVVAEDMELVLEILDEEQDQPIDP